MAHGLAFTWIWCFTVGLTLLAGPAASTARPDVSISEQHLLDWINQEGGRFVVTLGRNADGIRGVYTTQDVKKGDVLMFIPEHLALSFKAVAAAEIAPVLLKELHTPCSRLKPYMAVLPKEDEVLTGYNFPEEYIGYLASDHLEEQIRMSFKRHAKSTWEGQNNDNMIMTIPEAVGRANVSLPYWQYVVSMMGSRTFSFRKGVLTMVPLLDMANHDGRDVNQLDEKDGGYVMIAGEDLDRGEEVTISYGDMRPDELFLYYGFVDTDSHPPPLFASDHRLYRPYEQRNLREQEHLMGAEAEAEIARLEQLLKGFEARLRELGPVPETDPRVAAQVRLLHDRRRAGILSELEGLRKALAEWEDDEL